MSANTNKHPEKAHTHTHTNIISHNTDTELSTEPEMYQQCNESPQNRDMSGAGLIAIRCYYSTCVCAQVCVHVCLYLKDGQGHRSKKHWSSHQKYRTVFLIDPSHSLYITFW